MGEKETQVDSKARHVDRDLALGSEEAKVCVCVLWGGGEEEGGEREG